MPDTRTNHSIRNIRHALSIDETRSFFQPNHLKAATCQDCRVVWFAGVHADVGGGYPDKDAGLAKIALRWMLSEATQLGLSINKQEEYRLLEQMGQPNQADALAVTHNEAKRWGWRLLSLLPRVVYRLSYKENQKVLKRRLSFWNISRRRTIPAQALIHPSVNCRMADPDMDYKPRLPTEAIFITDPSDGEDQAISPASNQQ